MWCPVILTQHWMDSGLLDARWSLLSTKHISRQAPRIWCCCDTLGSVAMYRILSRGDKRRHIIISMLQHRSVTGGWVNTVTPHQLRHCSITWTAATRRRSEEWRLPAQRAHGRIGHIGRSGVYKPSRLLQYIILIFDTYVGHKEFR